MCIRDRWVVDVYDLPISQNLLVLPGTKLDQIKSVYSHQQAIAQSETFLRPVSYTHLDVYKRQALWFALLWKTAASSILS